MGNTQIKLNSDGVRDLLLSPEIEAVCQERASAALSRCGSGYESDTYHGKNRINAMVWAESPAAKADNAMNNTILKALK